MVKLYIDWRAKPRVCVRETYEEIQPKGCPVYITLKVWNFYYSDGTVETLTRRMRWWKQV